MKRSRAIAFVLLLASLAEGSATDAVLEGRVLGASGAPLTGAQVRLLPAGPSTTTGNDGAFILPRPLATEAVLEVRAPDHEPLLVPVPQGSEALGTLRLRRRTDSVVVQACRGGTGTGLSEAEGDELAPERVRNPTDAVAALAGGSSAGKGGQANVPAVRGLARGRTLLLVEDERVSSERRVGASAHFLPPVFLRRIEVLRGPEGVVHGSDAVGGVVLLSLREPTTVPGIGVEGGASVNTASDGVEPFFFVEGAGERWSGLLGLTLRDHGDVRAGGDAGLVGLSRYRDQAAWLRLRRRTARSDLRLGWLSYDASFLGKPDERYPDRRGSNPSDDRDLRTLRWSLALDDDELLEIHLANLERDTRRRNEIYDDQGTLRRVEASRDRSHDWQLRAAWTRTWSRARLRAGLDLLRRDDLLGTNRITRFPAGGPIEIDEEIPVPGGSFEDLAVFAGARLESTPSLTLEAGLRRDELEAEVDDAGRRSGDGWSGFLGARWREDTPFGIGILAGRAFRFPGLYELFYAGVTGRGVVQGNPDLPVESTRSWELLLGGRGSMGSWETRLFRMDLEDFVDRTSVGDDFFWISRERARLTGIEAAVHLRWASGWDLELLAQRIEGEDRSTGARLNDLPPDRLRVALERSGSSWNLGAVVLASAAMDEIGSEERPIGGSLLVGLRGDVELGGAYTLGWSLANLLDRKAFPNADPRGVPLSGRSLAVTVRYRFHRGFGP